MYEQTKKSETTTTRNVDEWIDGEGKFHRKTVFETITDPMDLNQATFPRRQGKRGFGNFNQKGFWRNLKPMDDPVFRGPIEPVDSKSPEIPAINVKEFIEKGKKILSGMGIDVETEIKNLFTKSKEEVNPDTTNSEEEPKTETKEPLNQKKEVNPWQKKQKPQKKQNQKKKK